MISYKTNPPHMYCPHCLNPCITHWLSTLSGGGGSPPIKIQNLTNLLLKNWYSIFGHLYQFNITKLRLGTTLLTPRMSSYVAHQAGNHLCQIIYVLPHLSVPHPHVFWYYLNNMSSQKNVSKNVFPAAFWCICYVKTKWISLQIFQQQIQYLFKIHIWNIRSHHEGTSVVTKPSTHLL